MLFKKALLSACALAALTAPSLYGAGVDFAPPPWDRNHPNALTGLWQFISNSPALGPEIFDTFSTKGGGPTVTGAVVTGPGAFWANNDGDTTWNFPANGNIHFIVDNVTDDEPIKYLRLQVIHSEGISLSVDPLSAINFAGTGSTVSSVTTTPIDSTSTLFTWTMGPNPPFESFDLLINSAGNIDSILLDTISIPEPASLSLLAIGALALFRRRRIA